MNQSEFPICKAEKEALTNNWGDKAESMQCFAEVKLIDPDSSWACYIYALNPNDEDEIACIIDGTPFEVCKWSLESLKHTYNKKGEYLIIDADYRRVIASELYKKLNG